MQKANPAHGHDQTLYIDLYTHEQSKRLAKSPHLSSQKHLNMILEISPSMRGFTASSLIRKWLCACQTRPAATRTSLFLKLPPELRLLIYEMVTQPAGIIDVGTRFNVPRGSEAYCRVSFSHADQDDERSYWSDELPCRKSEQQPPLLRLLHVCRDIRREAMPGAYASSSMARVIALILRHPLNFSM